MASNENKDRVIGVRHLLTKYEEDGGAWAEAWVQVDLLGLCWCLWRRRIPIG